MKAIIYFSFSREQSCKKIAESIEGDHYEINPNTLVKGLYFFNMFIMGFRTVTNRKVKLEKMDIDFDQYDEIHLVFPMWAGRPSVYMKQWLEENVFTDKKVFVYANSYSGDQTYLENFESYIDSSNEIIEKNSYKDEQKIV